MQAFKFKLETVLTLRERQEEAALATLTRCRTQLEREQEHLEELRREVDRHERLAGELRRGTVDVRALQSADRYRDSLRMADVQQSRKVLAAERAVEESAVQHLQRRTEKKALEQLRERQAGEHLRAMQHVEQNLLDEVAMRSWRNEA